MSRVNSLDDAELLRAQVEAAIQTRLRAIAAVAPEAAAPEAAAPEAAAPAQPRRSILDDLFEDDDRQLAGEDDEDDYLPSAQPRPPPPRF